MRTACLLSFFSVHNPELSSAFLHLGVDFFSNFYRFLLVFLIAQVCLVMCRTLSRMVKVLLMLLVFVV